MRSRTGVMVIAAGTAAGLGSLLAVGGCAPSSDASLGFAPAREDAAEVRFARRDIQPPLAVKPEGWVLDTREKKLGPPPPGHPKIVGGAVPDWTPDGGFGERGGGLNWVSVGPRPISSEYWSGEGNASGRVAGIAPHPTDPNTVYIAAASGGVWKTTNGGTSWTPISDGLATLNHGAIAVHPANPDMVLVGTGEQPTGSNGDGIFRSLDGGATWVRIGTAAQVGSQIAEIAVHPTDTNIIHVAGSRGYVRTLDGGATWSQRLTGTCNSVRIDVNNPDILFVGRSGQGVFRSLNGGGTVTRLTSGVPTSGIGDVHLTIGESNSQVVYAAILSSGGGLRGLYRSADGGNTWTQKTATPNYCSPQCWYDIYIECDPTNPDVLYAGGVDPRYATAGVLKSTNGGDTWSEISAYSGGRLHPDHHVLTFGPTGILWEGNDGGVWKSGNNGASWVNCNANLAISQLYNIVVHPTFPERMLGGTQDNGTPERTTDSTTWPQLQAGDGGYSAYDYSGTSRRYTTYVYLTLYRWNSGNSTNISGPWGSDPTNWISPVVVDPNTPTILVAGTNRVWRTTNASASSPTWTAVSTTAVGGGGTINALAVAKGNSSVIYAGSSSGDVSVTTNVTTWTNRSVGLPNGEISDVIVSPTEPGTAYVTYFNTSGARILRTSDYGVTWTNVTGTLPSGVGITALEVDFDRPVPGLFAGYGAGLYCSYDGGATWTRNNSTFPNVNVGDLTIDRTRRRIVAGTYGRGAWRADLPAVCPADFNSDGFLDFFDYDTFVECFESGACPAGRSADFNGDGFADFFDYDAYVEAFEAGC
jgi:photosystem II stability/assembly factor-like uncharacterized protein